MHTSDKTPKIPASAADARPVGVTPTDTQKIGADLTAMLAKAARESASRRQASGSATADEIADAGKPVKRD